MCLWFRCVLLSVGLAASGAGAARAQTVAASLEELKTLVGARSDVTITDANGRDVRGTLVEATANVLVMQRRGQLRRFDAHDIRMVRTRKQDSVVNGALIGAGVGGGLTSLVFLDNECRDDPVCYQAVALYAGLGALAGAAVDALIRRNVVVYLAPVVSGDRKGLQIAFGF